MRTLFLTLFCWLGWLAIGLAQGPPTSLTVPANGVVGNCSSTSVNQVAYNATVNAPGVQGIYAMRQSDYNILLNATNTSSGINFGYYMQASCVGGNVTSCSNQATNLVNDTTCIAFVNNVNQSLPATLSAQFGPPPTVSAAALAGTWTTATIVMFAVAGQILASWVA